MDEDHENSQYSDRRLNATRSDISGKNAKIRNSTSKATSQVRGNSRVNSAVDRNKSKNNPRAKGSPERTTANTFSGYKNSEKPKNARDPSKNTPIPAGKSKNSKSAG